MTVEDFLVVVCCLVVGLGAGVVLALYQSRPRNPS